MEAAPYDNVEFPVRKPGTGTWPGPGHHAQGMNTTSKVIHTQQTTRGDKAGTKLAPLMESVEMVEAEDQRIQAKMVSSSHMTSPTTATTAANSSQLSTSTVSSSYSSSSTPTSLQQSKSAHSYAAASTVSNTTPTYKAQQSPPTSGSPNSPQSPNLTLKSYQQKSSFSMDDESVDEFSRHNFNPASQALLDKAYTDHGHFYRLTTKILDEGSLLKQDVLDMYRKSGETLSYEQLLQGMLMDGEKLLIGGCWLYFSNVDFLDSEGKLSLKEPLGKGRVCLTSQRVLLLSTEISTEASLSEFGDPTKPCGGYKLQVKKGNSIFYQNLPLTCFHSAELDAAVGTAGLTKISVVNPICWGICSCFGVGRCARTWRATPPLTKIYNRRALRLGVSMPPWGTKMLLVVHLDPEMSLTTARDFISQLQHHAPHMH